MMVLGRVTGAVGGTLVGAADGLSLRGVSTDSRTLRPGELFVALRGPRHDGHDYVRAAFARGAAAAIVERPEPGAGPQIVVEDTLAALGTLAAAVRLTHPARFVSVSGSNGKTTTKEMIAHMLASRRRVVRAPASYNNEVGVPLTIFSAEPEVEVVVLELGTSRPGEIARLGRIARPDVAVLTSIGEEHLEALASLDGVAAEEASILDCVRSGGLVIAPAEAGPMRPHLQRVPREKLVRFGLGDGAELRAERLETGPDSVSFRVMGVRFELPMRGAWNAGNALAASAAAMALGMELEECAESLRRFRPPKMRMERLALGGVEILNDAYNSNPASAALAVEEFGRLPSRGRKIAVLGDMRELGPASARCHLELGRAVARQESIEIVILVGPEARAMRGALRPDQRSFTCDAVEDSRAVVMDLVRPGDSVLLKGSRSVGLERVVKYIAEKVTETRKEAGVLG